MPVIVYSYISRRQGGLDAETAKPCDGHRGHGSAGSTFRDPVVAGKRPQNQAEDEDEERSAPEAPREVAPWWSWSSTEEHEGLMAKTEEVLTQLATRIPKNLHRRLKLYCVTHDIMLQHFVTEAIEEKLGRKARPKKGTA